MKAEKPNSIRDLITRIAVGLLACGVLLLTYFLANQGKVGYESTVSGGVEYEKARVLVVCSDETQPNPAYENVTVGTQELELEILTGRYAGDQVRITNHLSPFKNYSIVAEEGMELSVRILTTDDNIYTVTVYNYSRSSNLWLFVAIFAVALILVGGKQGIAAIFGLALTMLAVLFVLLPLLVQKGWPPIPTTLLVVSVTMFASYVLIGGIKTKAMTAAFGAFGGVLLAGLFAFLAGRLVHISGMNMDEAEALFLTAADNGLNVSSLFVCGILISAEGAIMDIAMSVASAVEEVHRVDPDRGMNELFRSGMRVGRDAMGTMANTLVLAFAGTGLNMMIFIYAYDVSYTQLINTDFVAMEIIRALAGSLGMILTVPLVALVAASVFSAKKEQN